MNDTKPVVVNGGKGRQGTTAVGWSVQEDAVHHVVGQPSGSVGQVSFSAEARPGSEFLTNTTITFSDQENDGTVALGKIAGPVVSATTSGVQASVVQSTPLQALVADRSIPAVSSGTAIGALDLATQLVAPTGACTINRGGALWTLMGHDVGFRFDGSVVAPRDAGSATVQNVGDVSSVAYLPAVVDSANVTSWRDPLQTGEPQAATVYASSMSPQAGVSHIAMWIFRGANTSQATIVTGPDDSNAGTGITCTLTVDNTASTMELSGTYRPGGIITPFSASVSIASLDMSQPLQVVLAFGFLTATSWQVRASVVNGDGSQVSGVPVTVTTGAMGSNIDLYAEPLVLSGSGYIRNLYQETADAAPLVAPAVLANYLVPYVSPVSALTYEYHAPGMYLDDMEHPLASAEGDVWGYINNVLSLFGRTIRVDHTDGVGLVCELNKGIGSDIDITGDITEPQIAYDTSTAGLNIDYRLYETRAVESGVIYDARRAGETFSFEPGQTREVRISTNGSISSIKNPIPVSTLSEYNSLATTSGAYIVSGSDNLPIPALEWVSFGGSVTVSGSGPGYIELSVVAPSIPGIAGPYSLAVSDGSTQYPTLSIVGSGVIETSSEVRIPTGADPEFCTRELATSIDNPAISSHARMHTAHYWASSFAGGAKMTLTATMPHQKWAVAKFGLFQGTTFVWQNTRWRIVSGTVTDIGYQFTAVPFTTMEKFEQVWQGFTMDDFATEWAPIDGWRMRDFHIAPIKRYYYVG